uniref:Calcium-dependent protein kinase 11-like n=1 Tax=Tanacetum cinerariifolium TaxID=118510 RepID=A0A6L2M2M3_TANCI|nr:calcium-dependent protein kinase 11-like [Tanacetum cinerariifolium]
MLDRRPQQRIKAHEALFAPDKPLDSAVISRLKHFSALNKLKKMALRVIAERFSKEEIGGLKQMFKTIDADNSGTITFEELKQGLQRADTDCSGTIEYDGSEYITKEELQQAWKDFGLQDAQLEDMIKEVNDGRIDYAEFAAMIRKGDEEVKSRTMKWSLNFDLAEVIGIDNNKDNSIDNLRKIMMK